MASGLIVERFGLGEAVLLCERKNYEHTPKNLVYTR